ncbi:tetratricopeptide repeat protein, partial [uncultured Desulfovibrio sp.]|uniref:tetratricopeptide repeat protein n=1 Tax=uncultured Desulfovibrio sp. TaxID=167968 RepID=UPI0026103307
GLCYLHGEGVVRDEKEAFSLFERAACSDDPAPAYYELGNCCRDGRGVPRSSQNAQKWYRKAAELGHAGAREALARCASGTWLPSGQGADDGRPQDDAQSVERLRRAAEQGDARAQNALGRCFIDGDGVRKDAAQAAAWFLKAAEQGDDEAQYALGRCHEEGLGVPRDEAQAVVWYRRAAKQGNADAKLALVLFGLDDPSELGDDA